MSYNPQNQNGQTTKSASAPVTLASDQNNSLETGGNLATVATNTTGIATAAKQPALGTAGTASTDVITVQGIASGTPQNTTLSAETTKVIGVTRTADGSGNLLTSTSNAIDVNLKSGGGGVGAGATGSAVPANAVFNGVDAATALPTAATPGNLVGVMGDKFGRIVALNQAPRDLIFVSNATCTATTSPVTLIAAAGAGIFTDVTDVRLVNTSATGTEVDISDGTNTYYYYAPPTDMRGIVIQIPDPATTANTAWTITTLSSVTSVKATVKYINNK